MNEVCGVVTMLPSHVSRTPDYQIVEALRLRNAEPERHLLTADADAPTRQPCTAPAVLVTRDAQRRISGEAIVCETHVHLGLHSFAEADLTWLDDGARARWEASPDRARHEAEA